ncbi:MAG: bifunctional DNA-formamidopyrimidine glycosylase/DNA-(apurinic or apyrimidinic site) lyase [Alphaproteobacteria bacterium]|nr:bifunctional DNA-formamidopyrimidine glycosylase/DNA-(apurinic or apyrimidinic site) lyase [Alphaproteobacteria bacterium]
MPELPEVETVMRGLRPVLEGRKIVAVDQRRAGLRFPFPPDFARRLTGRRLGPLSRRAKYILAALDDGENLLIHLGMTGRFTVLGPAGVQNLGAFYFEAESDRDGKGLHDHLVLTLEDGMRIVYTDPRRFGVIDLVADDEIESHRLLRGLGVEPLGNEFNATNLAQRLAGKSAPLKAALLDQRIIAGLGNIYVCEALHRSGLSPRRKAGSLARKAVIDPRLERLVNHIRNILTEAIAAGGSTLQDFAHTDGSAGAFQQRFAVYDREGEACPACGGLIKRYVQSGRSTFYCKACQR